MIAWASRHNVKLISATEQLGDPTVYAEQMVPVLRAWLGEGESRSIQERMMGFYADRRKEGKWLGGMPPYGYKGADPLSHHSLQHRIGGAARNYSARAQRLISRRITRQQPIHHATGLDQTPSGER
jgi:DNA invertase Pin-like site-specific DNA recombinase